MKNKALISVISAFSMLTCSLSAVTAFAAPEPTTVVAADAEEPTLAPENICDTTETATINKDEIDYDALNALREEYINGRNTDYYSDPYYDTEGNASLIDSKEYKVIYSSTELLFTSVTTKDGHVFYIIIDYSDADGQNNVYFLNKVDDYDLYSLLSEDTNDKGGTEERPKQSTVAKPSSDNKTVETTAEVSEDANKQKKSAASAVKLYIALAAVILLGVGAFVLPKFITGSKKKAATFVEEDELEEVSDDDEQ